jgi:hypothetical protein
MKKNIQYVFTRVKNYEVDGFRVLVIFEWIAEGNKCPNTDKCLYIALISNPIHGDCPALYDLCAHVRAFFVGREQEHNRIRKNDKG